MGDFGLSRIKRNTLVSGGVRGTLPWMAPELLNGSSSRVSEKVRIIIAFMSSKTLNNGIFFFSLFALPLVLTG